MIDDYAIVADIGGTNARFSRVNLQTLVIDKIAVYACTDFPGLREALVFYQQLQGLNAIKQAALAIACPVQNDQINMTNFHWQFSIREIKEQLGFNHFQVINDFAAQAMCLPALKPTDLHQIGRGGVDKRKPKVVLGAGTGLGVAYLIPTSAGFLPLEGEGGHCDWSPQTDQEWFIQRFLAKEYGHVSVERLLSGTGLEKLYLAIGEFQQQPLKPLSASEIASLALAEQSTLAKATVAQFFASLGSYAGNLALTLSTFGGVYIAGGIVPKLLPLIEKSEFRKRFEAKGRFLSFNQQIATFVVKTPQPGLLGAAMYLKQLRASEQDGID